MKIFSAQLFIWSAIFWMTCHRTHGQAGDVDPTFDATVSGTVRFTEAVYALTVQMDGKVLVGGSFAEVNGVSRRCIARLNSDGSLDTSFDPGTGGDDTVFNITVQPDGKLLVSGIFNSLNGGSAGLARLNSNGSLDTSFAVSLGAIYAMARHPSGYIYVAQFRNMYRLNPDGTMDPTFHVSVPREDPNDLSGQIADIKVQPDARVLFAGNFAEVSEQPRWNVARLNAGGALDDAFLTEPGGSSLGVSALGIRSDGKIYQVGRLLSRLESNGTLDTNFTVVGSSFGFFDAIAVQRDGKPVVGGNFSEVQGRNALARFNNDGTVDEAFGGLVDGMVEAVAIQPDGRILIGGTFLHVNGTPRTRIARLLGDSPVLDRQRAGSDKLVLSWPSLYTNHILQSCTNLSSDGWASVSNAVTTLSNGMNSVTNSIISSGHRFFRLAKP